MLETRARPDVELLPITYPLASPKKVMPIEEPAPSLTPEEEYKALEKSLRKLVTVKKKKEKKETGGTLTPEEEEEEKLQAQLNSLYHPLQREELQHAVHTVIRSLNQTFGDKWTFFGGRLSLSTPDYAGYRNSYEKKTEMLRKIHNAILSSDVAPLRNYLTEQKRYYPSSHPYLIKFRAALEVVVGLIGMVASTIAASVTGFAAFGMIPSIYLVFHGCFLWDKANQAEEIRDLLKLQHFLEDDSFYSNAKKELFCTVGWLPKSSPYEDTQDDKKVAPSIEVTPQNKISELVLKFLQQLDRSQLSTDEKTQIVTSINQVLSDPLNQVDNFANYVTKIKTKYPATSAHCEWVQRYTYLGAFIIGALSVGLAWLGGFSLLALPVVAGVTKLGMYQDKRISLACAIETLDSIQGEIRRPQPRVG